MPYQVELGWKVFSNLTPHGVENTKFSSPLFNIKGAKSFLRTFGGNPRAPYAPTTLEPTINFHQALRPTRERLGIDGKKLSFKIRLNGATEPLRVNIGIRKYSSYVCASVKVEAFPVTNLRDIFILQNLNSHDDLCDFIFEILAITTAGNTKSKKLATPPKIFPIVQINDLGPRSLDTLHRLAEIVTRHTITKQNIVDSVLTKNNPHQIDETLILIDKQGILSYLPPNCNESQLAGNFQRFNNASALIEFANAINRELRSGCISAEQIDRIIKSPKYFLPDSISAQRMWELLVVEFGIQNELTQKNEDKMTSTTHKVLLVTVTDIETDAIIRTFKTVTGCAATMLSIDGHPYHSLGKVGVYEVYHSRSEMGAAGMGGSQATVARSLKAISPDFVVMVGIAFGIDRKKQPIGQILVSKQLYLYDLQRISKNNSIALRGDKPSSSVKLLNWVNGAKLTWSGAKVEAGLIFSGEKLIDNTDYRDQLHSLAPDAVGGEMEGSGLYVACQSEKTDWILIKAVCDWADGNKGKNKQGNQEKAAQSASTFVAHLISVMQP